MAVDRAQIGPDQSVGDDGCVFSARARGHERIADEAPELLLPDHDRVHAPAGK